LRCQAGKYFHQFHHVAFDALWTSILGQPKISRMEAKAVSLDSPKLLDRMRAEIRTRHPRALTRRWRSDIYPMA
jgi:hypothetical protein